MNNSIAEDIKILEEFRKSIKNCNIDPINTNILTITKKATEHLIESLEHLIERVKELEERKKIWVKIDENNNIIPLLEDYIPKSKVKEKIEEYKKLYENETENVEKVIEYCTIIKILQELLKGDK